MEPSDDDIRAPLRQAASRHDDALNALLRVYQTERIPQDPESWSNTFRAWHTVVLSTEYWRLSRTLDEFGSFEPVATEGEFEALRRSAMLRAVEPLLSASREALIEEDEESLKSAVRILSALSDTGDWVETARVEIFQPFTEAIDRACTENREIFGVKVVRTDESAQANIQLCNDLLQHYREAVETSLARLRRVAERDQSEERTARENVARCLSRIGGAFTWADRYVESEALFQEALSLAEGTIAAVEIERSLQDNKGAADKERRVSRDSCRPFSQDSNGAKPCHGDPQYWPRFPNSRAGYGGPQQANLRCDARQVQDGTAADDQVCNFRVASATPTERGVVSGRGIVSQFNRDRLHHLGR